MNQPKMGLQTKTSPKKPRERWHTLCLSMLVAVLLLTAGCLATATPPRPLFLTAAGSTSMEPLMRDLANAYAARHPHITFDIQGGGSQTGRQLVAGGQINLGMVSWPPQNLDGNYRLEPVARDAIAIIVHPNNRRSGLSLADLQHIFSGRLLNWREVDGPALPVQVVSREDGSGTRQAFEAMVMGDLPVTPAAVVLPNSRAVVEYVAQNPAAIAYVSFAFITSQVYAIPIQGVSPTPETLSNGSYPLTRDLALIVPDPARQEVNEFVAFALSPTGQAITGQRWGRIVP